MNDVAFTQAWWLRTLADPNKLARWLQKLQRTELGGYQDHLRFMADHAGKLDARERLILNNIADDELKHAGWLVELMTARGIPVEPQGEESSYWADMLAGANTFSRYCAANHFGEELAAWRFWVLLDMPETPEDIRHFLKRALPDETFHRETLRRLATPEDLAEFRLLHLEAVTRLKDRRA